MNPNPFAYPVRQGVEEEVLRAKLDAMETPGALIEFEMDEAELLGAFREDALSEEAALEAAIDKDQEVDHG